MAVETGVSFSIGGSSGPSNPGGSSWAILPAQPPVVTMPPEPAAPPAEPTPYVPSSVARATTVQSKRVSGATKTETRYRTTKVQETVVHTLSDNGAGGLGAWGTVNYAGKSINAKFLSLDSTTDGYKSDHEDSTTFDGGEVITGGTTASNNSLKGGEYLDNAMSEQLDAAACI